MKSSLRVLEEMLAVWLVCLLAGSSCAVFYSQSNNNDFPRLGRRSIFTSAGDGVFPRIGRSGAVMSSANAADAATGSGVSTSHHRLSSNVATPLFDASYLSALHKKRGIFTAGEPGFPRIGRAQVKRSRSGELSAAAMTSVEEPEVRGSEEEEEEEEETHFVFPLGLLFFEFDKDGDKSLSREEFVRGMARARQERALFR